MPKEIAIGVNNVSKDFKLPHLKKNSLKSVFTGVFDRASSKRGYEMQHALRNVSFEVKKGEFFGIVGRNGSGKSTLLKMIAGIYQPSKGSITVNGKLVPFIELGVGFNAELTGRENVYLNGAMLGFSEKEVSNMYDEIVEFAELEKFMDQKLKNYSSGMQVRLAFSMAIRANAEVLLVDEVLAVGDADFQRKCFAYFRKLKKEKKTVVFVTHDMNAVREYCDRAVLINKSEMQSIGSPEKIAQEYAKLFMDHDGKADKEAAGEEGERWGNDGLKYGKLSIKLKDNNINISAVIEASKPVENVLYGLHVFSADGSELTATNNRMIGVPNISKISANEKFSLEWEMLNIFNDGDYLVTLTLADSNGNVFDWYNNALSFKVKRQERSTTSIIPPIKVNAERVKL